MAKLIQFLAIWTIISIPVGLFVGRFIHVGSGNDKIVGRN